MALPIIRPLRLNVNRLVAALVLAFVTLFAPVSAQSADDGSGVRLGVSLGGISTLSVNVEFFRDSRSIDVALGTWSFRDVSVSAVVKQYMGSVAVRPVVGAGLWLVAAAPGDDRTGLAVVFRAPVGLDWEVSDPHALGLFLNLNRGLFVRRSNPRDDRPLNKRIVPLPELYYRLTR